MASNNKYGSQLPTDSNIDFKVKSELHFRMKIIEYEAQRLIAQGYDSMSIQLTKPVKYNKYLQVNSKTYIRITWVWRYLGLGDILFAQMPSYVLVDGKHTNLNSPGKIKVKVGVDKFILGNNCKIVR